MNQKHRVFHVALMGILGVSAVASAQSAAPRDFAYPIEQRRLAPAEYTKLAEDMEIMQLLVHEAMQQAFQSPIPLALNRYSSSNANNALLSPATTVAPLAQPVASYLPGMGVVFQLVAPPIAPSAQAAKTTPGESDWERARKRLQRTGTGVGMDGTAVLGYFLAGAKAPPAPAGRETRSAQAAWLANTLHHNDCVTCHATNVQWSPSGLDAGPTREKITERLLDLLLDNGPRLRGLVASDRITIAITFQSRPAAGAAACTRPQSVSTAIAAPGQVATSEPVPGRSNNAVTDDFQSAMLAADLHLRQANYSKAAEAYEKLLSLNEFRSSSQASGMARPVLERLVQAYTGMGHYDRAQQLLAQLHGSLQGNGAPDRSNPSSATSNTAKGELALPARLIVSLTKGQLEQLASGALPRADAARVAVVQYFEANKPAAAAAAAPTKP